MATLDRTAAPDLTPARAIIDIGSNTVRLVIYGGPPRAPTVLHNEKVSAKLGRGLAESGYLPEKAVKAALAALARYRALLDLMAVRQIDVVATAAVRDAADGAAFLDAVRTLGFAPRLLSGEEEAIASAMGVIGAFPGASGIVADLGGGSLELIDIDGDSCRHGVSLPLGTLRLPPLRAGGDPAFGRAVARTLAAADWSAPHSPTLYLVGGSFRSFARYAMQQGEWPSDDPHGFSVDAESAAVIARGLARKSGETLLPVPGIGAARLGTLPDAAALLGALIRTLKPSELIFSSWGLREGLLFSSLEAGLRRQDPLLAAMAAFVAHHGAAPATATMVAGWTAPANLPNSTGGRERLRLAATMLALASANVEPNLRTDLAVAWAMRKRWIGLSNRDRAMLAAGLMANTGRLDVPPLWRHFATADDLREAQGWGLAVRLCRRFSSCSPRSLSGSALLNDGALLTLVVRRPFDALINDGVERDLKALGTHLGLRAQCEVIGESDRLR
jgi:exopolyphosphatase/guanosine-5'-triphosphate,3'-diphosphate pyrophosphatase